MASEQGRFWFNTRTGQVDEGHQAGSGDLMGPYATRADAETAYERARARTEAWDAEDERDRDA